MNNFKKFNLELYKSENIKIDFYECIELTILLFKVSGHLADGSNAIKDCRFIRQQLGLSLITYEPIGIIMDLSDLYYFYGNSIIEAFRPIYEIDPFNGEGFQTVYVLSDKNKFGLSSIWCFEVEKPKENIYYNFKDAYDYLIRIYDK